MAIRLAVDPETYDVKLLCSSDRIATIEAGKAICPRCGSRMRLDVLAGRLRHCRQSLDGLIDAVEEEIEGSE